LSIDNAVLGPIPKYLLFSMVMNADFIGSLDSNPYRFQLYDISNFALFVNGKPFRNKGLSLGKDHEKTYVMGYRTLFETSGIYHWNSGLQKTHDMFINTDFMLLFDVTPYRSASEGHTFHPEHGIIIIELMFNKVLPEAITCLLYLDFDNSVLVDFRETSRPTSKREERTQCKYCIHSPTYTYPSTFSPTISYPIRSREISPSSSMPIPTHRERFTLAIRTLPTQVCECIVLRVLWHRTALTQHIVVHKKQLHDLLM